MAPLELDRRFFSPTNGYSKLRSLTTHLLRECHQGLPSIALQHLIQHTEVIKKVWRRSDLNEGLRVLRGKQLGRFQEGDKVPIAHPFGQGTPLGVISTVSWGDLWGVEFSQLLDYTFNGLVLQPWSILDSELGGTEQRRTILGESVGHLRNRGVRTRFE